MDALFSQEVRETLISAHRVVGWGLLFFGLVAVATRKGGRTHRKAGVAFFWLMVLTVLVAVALELRIRLLPWTFVLAAAAACCLFSGYVAARQRNRWPGTLALLLIFLTAALGIAFLFTPGLHGSSLRPRVLGVGMLTLAACDIATWRRPGRRHWWFVHLRHMLASFSFALTAFSGATLKSLPTVVWKWWPILLGFIAIVAFSRHYQKKLRDPTRESTGAQTGGTGV